MATKCSSCADEDPRLAVSDINRGLFVLSIAAVSILNVRELVGLDSCLWVSLYCLHSPNVLPVFGRSVITTAALFDAKQLIRGVCPSDPTRLGWSVCSSKRKLSLGASWQTPPEPTGVKVLLRNRTFLVKFEIKRTSVCQTRSWQLKENVTNTSASCVHTCLFDSAHRDTDCGLNHSACY